MRARFLALWIAAVVASAAAFVVHLALRFETVRFAYEVEEARRDRERLIEERRLLTLEAATLRHPERLEAIAKGVLGMEEPSADHVLLLGESNRAEKRRPSGRVR